MSEQNKTTFEEVLEKDGKLFYTNKGVSMMPLLRQDRDIMVIEKIDVKNCKRLDAVLFLRPNFNGKDQYVLHRIIKIDTNGNYFIIGDNCYSGETVKPDQIIGKLIAVVRDGKTIYESDIKYRIYVQTWCRFWRFRIFILKLIRRTRSVLSFIKRRIL